MCIFVVFVVYDLSVDPVKKYCVNTLKVFLGGLHGVQLNTNGHGLKRTSTCSCVFLLFCMHFTVLIPTRIIIVKCLSLSLSVCVCVC